MYVGVASLAEDGIACRFAGGEGRTFAAGEAVC